MVNKKSESQINRAHDLLDSIKGTPLTLEVREKQAIELGSYILTASNNCLKKDEKKRYSEIHRMIHDPIGKCFTTAMSDQCFRSYNNKRIANQVIYLLNLYGIPKFLSPFKKFQLFIFKKFGDVLANILVPIAIRNMRKETESVIIPGEKSLLIRHIKKRKNQGIKLNLNHLGEAVLGEKEALARLNIYLDDLKHPDIDYISIKISTIYSQINLVAREQSLNILSERLQILYRAAMQNPLVNKHGKTIYKFINLDMEEYGDLHLTKDLFIHVLNKPEFLSLYAGIVLQAYLPDSYDILKELTDWSIQRVKKGGAPIKIRLVKGANLCMEQHEASLKNWPQAPYTSKIQADANYKRMLLYACNFEHARAVHIGVASHNIFDISFALLLRSENQVENEVSFEMLEGMADHMCRIIKNLTGNILLYCAVANLKDFKYAIPYLIRRLDENTGTENFLAHLFNLKPGTKEWKIQSKLFSESCKLIKLVETTPRRKQNRFEPPVHLNINNSFDNEPDTDFSQTQNSKWAEEIIFKWKEKKIDPIPLVINGKEIQTHNQEQGFDPSNPKHSYYTYSLASWNDVDTTLNCAKKYENNWKNTSVDERCTIINQVAKLMRENRADQLGAIIGDGGKTIFEADIEFSETIDFLEYYIRSITQLTNYKDLEWNSKGTILVASPWNFPNSIPAGGIASSLLTGNCVIFKPAPEAVLTGWELVKLFWKGGVPKHALQFLNCLDDPVGSQLIKDQRLNGVILTGATKTSQLFTKMQPGLDLYAETGGKNSLIITDLSDRDQGLKDLVQSAFSHSGQKCSAASIGILEKDLYNDSHFLNQLRDATESLKVGSQWNLSTMITPLIRQSGPELYQAQTTLDPGESWLLEPKQDSSNPNLWSPGIKLGVKQGSFMHRTELFGPVLGLIRADNLDHGIHIANSSPYGLTSGIHSLDKREQKKWQRQIISGNGYINRTITGAIVRRQPFGGCKNSSYGRGSKAGGPNYLTQLMHVKQLSIPKEKFPVSQWVNNLTRFLEKFDLSAEELGIWYASISSYAFFWQQFKRDKDRSKIVGEDNIFRYLPHKKLVLRLSLDDLPLDYLRAFASALTTETRLEISWEKNPDEKVKQANWEALLPIFNIVEEDEPTFAKRLSSGKIKRIRMVNEPSLMLKKAAAEGFAYIDHGPVLANGRIELLHYLREMSLSISYHRYGNLGLREGELRKSIL